MKFPPNPKPINAGRFVHIVVEKPAFEIGFIVFLKLRIYLYEIECERKKLKLSLKIIMGCG